MASFNSYGFPSFQRAIRTPVTNDTTIEDAKEAGLADIVRAIGTGNDRIGVNFESSSVEFLREFKKAELIIAKGQGNLESLDNVEANTFFISRAKCGKIARALEVNHMDIAPKKESPNGAVKRFNKYSADSIYIF